MGSVGGTFKALSHAMPLPGAEHLPLHQIAQIPAQPGLEHFQYRITEWVGLERTFKDQLICSPWPGHRHLLSILRVVPSPIQPGLEHLQGGGSHSCSGQPGPGPQHPQSKEFLPSA